MEGIDCLMHYKTLYVSARSGTQKGRDGEVKVSCVQEVMFRRCFIVFSRGIGATTNIKTVVAYVDGQCPMQTSTRTVAVIVVQRTAAKISPAG